MRLSIGDNDALGLQSWSTEYSAASRLQDATRSTSSSNWGDRAAAFSLKAMVAEAGGDVSGIITEEDLARTQFGERPEDHHSFVPGRRASRAAASSRVWI